jgi:hypothetical protein
MSIQKHNLGRVGGAALLAAASVFGGTACSSHASSPPPASAAAPAPPKQQAVTPPPAASPEATGAAPGREATGHGEDAELVVSHEIVSRCPALRVVKAHVAEFDPGTVWLAVLESIGECMSEGGPLGTLSIGVSGDEQHRHVVREVLGSRGVAPTRIVAAPPSAGAAECQGGDCETRVELTLIPQP